MQLYKANWANLIFIIWGKSSIIKLEFKTMQKGGNFKVVNDKTNQRKIASLFLDNYPFNLHTWDFLGHELEEKKILGRPPILFFIYLMKPSFFSGCHPEKKIRLNSKVLKVPIFSKLKIGCRLKGRTWNKNGHFKKLEKMICG